MPENDCFDRRELASRNIHSLSKTNPELCSRLSGVQPGKARYKVLESRSGERTPGRIDANGTVHALHSAMDPRKEAKRLIGTAEEGFLVFLGLGGGFYVEEALERDETGMALAIEFDLQGFAELISLLDFSRLFGNPRFRLLLDPSAAAIEETILGLYQPVLYGGIRVIPLLPRTSLEPRPFAEAGKAIEAAIDRVSGDYSVQAHFGKRWFANALRNLDRALELDEEPSAMPLAIHRAAVCAAGPSLSLEIPRLQSNREDLFLIATDTSLPCLLQAGLKPDAVISIDCQHISLHHFMNGLPEETRLFLDLASPPLLARLSQHARFFTGGHPLTRYISAVCKDFPALDTSGGNVTYAAVSLAERLGAREIELYGADFSYPLGVTYARGAYIYPLFAARQNRLLPLEAQASAFLYRTPLKKREKVTGNKENNTWYYETSMLKLYRERLEEKSETLEAALAPLPGGGAPINLRRVETRRQSAPEFLDKKTTMKTAEANLENRTEHRTKLYEFASAYDFLGFYREEIARLPEPGKNGADYMALLNERQRAVFTTLLPTAAAIKRRESGANFPEVIEKVKTYCLKELDTIMSAGENRQ